MSSESVRTLLSLGARTRRNCSMAYFFSASIEVANLRTITSLSSYCRAMCSGSAPARISDWICEMGSVRCWCTAVVIRFSERICLASNMARSNVSSTRTRNGMPSAVNTRSPSGVTWSNCAAGKEPVPIFTPSSSSKNVNIYIVPLVSDFTVLPNRVSYAGNTCVVLHVNTGT